MKQLIILTLILLSTTLFAQTEYEQNILKNRKERNEEMLSDSSILNEEEKENFNQLEFYPVSDKYKVIATFKKDKGKKFKMKTSTDRLPVYRKYGVFSFELNDSTYHLSVYQNMRLKGKKEFKNYLFLPLNDLTSPDETYGAGRYIDLERHKSNKYTIDFNLLYNPYCAYSYRYSCPITPAENWLKTRIEAGEKIPNLETPHE